MKRYKAGKAVFTDKAHLKAKGTNPGQTVRKGSLISISKIKMKTFKKHIKEGGMTQSKYTSSSSTTSVSLKTATLRAHNIENPEVLKKVNAFVGAIAEQEYINPESLH